jgi:hypothetical protein
MRNSAAAARKTDSSLSAMLASDCSRTENKHAGAKVVGNTSFKYLAVHIVDKGAPLYDAPPK